MEELLSQPQPGQTGSQPADPNDSALRLAFQLLNWRLMSIMVPGQNNLSFLTSDGILDPGQQVLRPADHQSQPPLENEWSAHQTGLQAAFEQSHLQSEDSSHMDNVQPRPQDFSYIALPTPPATGTGGRDAVRATAGDAPANGGTAIEIDSSANNDLPSLSSRLFDNSGPSDAPWTYPSSILEEDLDLAWSEQFPAAWQDSWTNLGFGA